MQLAFTAARDGIQAGMNVDETLAFVKRSAIFAGTMRTNMVSMLDAIGTAAALGIDTTVDLIADAASVVHTTSALRYPVFVDGRGIARDYAAY